MKRRKFIQYGMLGSVTFLSALVLLNLKLSKASLSVGMNKKQRYDWIFLYWMPYDNNLSRFGTPIMNMIARGFNVGTQWMNIKKLSDAIANFNQQINDRVELFFFQNCNKGTLEAHYTLRDTAKYTLSSQRILGAPNYYYESLFQFIGNHPELNGEQLAQKIREFEGSDMYHSYTVTNNRFLSEIPKKLNSFIDSILSANYKSINLNKIRKYSYFNEQYVDFIEFCKTITQQSGADPEKRHYVIESLTNSMIHMVNPLEKHKNLSGMGLFLPFNQKQLDKYRYLPIYSDSKLSKLFDAILFD